MYFGSNGTEKDAVAKTIHEEGGITDNFFVDSLFMNSNEFKTRLLDILNDNYKELLKLFIFLISI